MASALLIKARFVVVEAFVFRWLLDVFFLEVELEFDDLLVELLVLAAVFGVIAQPQDQFRLGEDVFQLIELIDTQIGFDHDASGSL
ncbi:hypothetical protein D3C78_1559730 [compost metagenome]